MENNIVELNILTDADFDAMEQKFLDTLMARDHLLYQETDLIMAEYMEKIGLLEHKLYEFQISYQRMKRKLELVRQKINCQEKIVMKNIEFRLDAEYAEYEEKIAVKLAEITDLLSVTGIMPESEAKELRDLYKLLVKRLHPDLNPDLSNEQFILFYKAVDAYKNSDINTLRRINLLTDKITETIPNKYEAKKLRYNNLKKYCEEMEREMEEIRKKFPFDKIPFLKDKQAVKLRQSEIQASLEDYKEQYSELEKKLEELLA